MANIRYDPAGPALFDDDVQEFCGDPAGVVTRPPGIDLRAEGPCLRHNETEPGLPTRLAEVAALPPTEVAVLRRALDLACGLLALGASGKATRLAAEFEARARRELDEEARV